ncbi:MAG TPA: cytochrome c biogenesis protein ResB [Paludibacteraceae bacterium]|nr:cytochrome c biogenesis protein ResB [Paludibacteraceae bacterium]HOU69138.1 cytochrome c biogenesis protein ResB [Paludibacteraceae bacterium]HPH63455.1 cytochrome c biogenesis protein ResB [Paludibacteraceae bacterium]HQF50927.1 cytochrome c biogenesis protein ResB [Paludibacteraceae bacterium]
MWSKLWRFKEGVTICCGLLIVGVILQLSLGSISWGLFAYPVNLIVALVFCVLLFAMYALKKKIYLFLFLQTYYAAVPTLVVVVFMTLIMGLTRQVPETMDAQDPMGFTYMLRSWPFVLVYFYMAVILGLVSIKHFLLLNFRQIPFILFHLGLFVVIVAGTLGSADMQRLTMNTSKETPEWRAVDNKGEVYELPIAVTLEDFYIAEPPQIKYVSKVHVITEKGLDKHYQIEVNKPIRVEGWVIYQYSYYMDSEQGMVSVLELVKDPWLPAVYVGLILLFMGAVFLFVNASSKEIKCREI